MAIHNINMIQHQEDVHYLVGSEYPTHYPTDNEKDFYIQSLANMGQRVGTSGNNINYNAITIKDLFNITDEDVKIISLQYNISSTGNTYAKISDASLDKSESESKSLDNLDSVFNIFNKYYFTNVEEFSVPINNIEKYAPDSIIYNDGDYIIMCLSGKVLGTDDGDENNVEIQYNKIDVKTGIIYSAIRAFHLEDETYILMVLDTDKEDKINQMHTYKLMVTSFNLNNFAQEYDDPTNNNLEDIKQLVKNAFTWEKCQNKEDNPWTFRYLGQDITIASLEDLLYYDETIDRDKSTIFGLLEHYSNYHGENATRYFVSNVVYNTSTDTGLSFDTNTLNTQDYKMQHNLLIHDPYGLEGRLVAINNDAKFTYPNILHIYSLNKYNSNKNSLFYEILYTLYEKLCTECYDFDRTSESYPILYIPTDFVIKYMYNALDFKVYYIDDVFITFVNEEDYPLEDILTDLQAPTFVYDDDEKVSAYKIFIKYNDQYNNYIDTIVINEQYTLPYINSSNTWQINDKDSKLSAVGKNAGNPNIIITKTTYEEDGTISGKRIIGANYNILKSLDWEIKEYDNELYAYIPKVNVLSSQYLENAIIFNIYKKDNNSYSSIWTLQKNQYAYDNNLRDEYEFTIVTDENEILNIDSLFSLSTTVEKIIREENYLNQNLFTDIIISSYVNTPVNSDISDQEYIKCHIHGELQDKDKDVDSIHTSSNDNDTILTLEYELQKDNRYISYINDIKDELVIKNCLFEHNYPIYEIGEHTYIPGNERYQYVEANSSQNIASTTFGSNLGDSSNEYGHVQEDVNSQVSESNIDVNDTQITYYQYDQCGFYTNEYIFGSNTPSLLLGEMLLQDVNTINRTNILTIDRIDSNSAKIYNSYIGSSFIDDKKNVLHIGSYSTNINIGTKTLIDPGYNQHFAVQDTLALDFEKLELNNEYITENSFPITKQILDNTTYNFISPKIISKSSNKEIELKLSQDNEGYDIYSIVDNTSMVAVNIVKSMNLDTDVQNEIIFKPLKADNDGNSKTGLISVNALMKKYCKVNLFDYTDITLTVNYGHENRKSSTLSTNTLSSSDLLDNIAVFTYVNSKNYYIYVGIDEVFDTDVVKFINSPLNIMWYINDDKITIDIDFISTQYSDNKKFKPVIPSVSAGGGTTITPGTDVNWSGFDNFGRTENTTAPVTNNPEDDSPIDNPEIDINEPGTDTPNNDDTQGTGGNSGNGDSGTNPGASDIGDPINSGNSSTEVNTGQEVNSGSNNSGSTPTDPHFEPGTIEDRGESTEQNEGFIRP